MIAVAAGTVSARTVVNADIDAAAAIARTKIADGSASHVIINDGSGTLSSEASLDETRGGTGQSTLSTGDTIYASGANTFSKLAPGSNGQIYTLAAGVPSWAAAGSASLTVLDVSTDDTTITTASDVILVDTSGGARRLIFQLP